MVFSSIPTYLDPSNWQQQHQNHLLHHHHHHQNGSSGLNSVLLPPVPPSHGGSSGSSIRPGSMAERARMANIPVPDMALKCPRCDSTNTKFCYFNNYSLTQPRHFCKTCRRYWTRGGALRNIPVGGGCRRNSKRSRSSARSKSPATVAAIDSGTSSTATSSGLPLNHFPPGLQILASSNLPNYHHQLMMTPDLGGETYGEMVSPLGFQQGQHLSLFGSSGGGFMFPLDHQGSGADEAVGAKEMSSFGDLGHDSVKMEENQEMNLSRRFLGMLGNNGDQCSNWNNNNATSSSAWANNLSAGF